MTIQHLKSTIQNLEQGPHTKSRIGIVVGLFVIALLPRIFGLGIFLTSDEPLWLTRSVFFSEALLTGNLAETFQVGHPGVTTMWTGSLGLGLGYLAERPSVSFTEFIQTLPHSPDQLVVGLMPWARLPTAVLAAVCVVLLYLLGAKLIGNDVALIAALLLAFDPLFLAHSRTLHHDALVTIFMSLSVLSLLCFSASKKFSGKFYLVLSGVLAGLALLSKGTSLALIVYTPLFLIWLWWVRKWPFRFVLYSGFVWLGAAVGVFIAFWPAMWVIPGQVLHEVFAWAFGSANVGDVLDTTAFNWNERVPDLGLLFYPVNWLLKSTLLSVVGLVSLIGWWRTSQNREKRWVVIWIAVFSLLFTAVLTIGDKRDGRYLLPIYPGLWLLTAAGLAWLFRQILESEFWLGKYRFLRFGIQNSKSRMAISVGLAITFLLMLMLFSLPWYPYYHSYYNPLIRGSWLAPRLVKVGWGEGMEQAAVFLNQQPSADRLVVATSYAQNLSPFFVGKNVKHHHSEWSDYVLNYIRQIQNGYPYPEYWQYYKVREPVFQIVIGGIDYLWLYEEPSLMQVRNANFDNDLELMGYVLNTKLPEPGKTIRVTLVWRVGENSPSGAMVSLRLIDDQGKIWGVASPEPVLDPAGPSLVEGHYQLTIFPDAPRFDGQLDLAVIDVNGQSLGSYAFGQIPVRQKSLPPYAVALPDKILDNQISLLGYHVSTTTATPGDVIEVTLYWQGLDPINFDYTVFSQLVDAEAKIHGQHDGQPVDGELPTSQWTVGEVVEDRHSVMVVPDTSPGEYYLVAGLYRWDTGKRLSIRDENTGSETAITLTQIVVQ